MISAAAKVRGWDVAPIWTIATRIDRTGYSDAELLSVYRDWGVVRKADRDDNFNVESEDLSNYKFVRPGDLVLNKMKTWQGSLAVSDYEGIVSPAYFTCTLSPRVHPRYIHYLLRSDAYIALYAAASKGIRPNQWDLPFDEFRGLPALLPTMEEQRRIADFLDDQVARIDALLGVRQKQLRLLAEGELASIDELVMTASEGAARRRIGSLARVYSGAGFPVDEQGLEAGQVAFMKVSDLAEADQDGTVERAANYVTRETAQRLGARPAPVGTIVFPKVGAALLTNRRAVLGVPAVFDNNVMGLYFVGQSERFYLRVLNRVDFGVYSNPGPVPSVNESTVKDILVPWPSRAIQDDVAAEIDSNLASGHGRRAALLRSIGLLNEYKRSLITAAVTGELDVSTASGRGVPA